jgi:hypothetical protein
VYWTEPIAVSQLKSRFAQGRPDGVFAKPQTRFFGVEVRLAPALLRRRWPAAKEEERYSSSATTNQMLCLFHRGSKLSRGMAAGVDFLQLADVDLGIDRGGFQALVAKQLLDVTDVRAAFEHVGGAGVA